MPTIETSDIFRSAYHLTQGSELDQVRVSGTGRGRAVFLIRGKDVARLDRAYLSGQARVNPLQLRECLNHLRDKLFERLHEHEKKEENTDDTDDTDSH